MNQLKNPGSSGDDEIRNLDTLEATSAHKDGLASQYCSLHCPQHHLQLHDDAPLTQSYAHLSHKTLMEAISVAMTDLPISGLGVFTQRTRLPELYRYPSIYLLTVVI